jgi:outer membrane protein assembly factor BamB
MNTRLLALPCVWLGLVFQAWWSPAAAEEWFRFRGPQLNGLSTEDQWSHAWGESGPLVAWRSQVGVGLSGLVVSAGRVYTLGNTDDIDAVFCLDAHSGQVIWQHSYPAPVDSNEFEGGPTSTPTVSGDQLFTLSRQGDLLCFDKATGQVQWHQQVAELAGVRVPTWGFAGSPLVLEDLVLVNVGEAGVAVQRQTGELVWNSADRDAGYSSIVPFTWQGQAAVIFGSARAYVCVEPTTGREMWRHRWLTTFGCNAADPIIFEDKIFISSGYNRGCVQLDASGPEVTEIWKHKEMQNQISSCVLIDGFLYGIHGDVGGSTQLRCIQWSTGKVQWSDDSFRPGAISAAGRRLIVVSDDGELLIMAAESQASRVLARYRGLQAKCWTAPVLSSGQLYCRSALGELLCLRLAGKASAK